MKKIICCFAVAIVAVLSAGCTSQDTMSQEVITEDSILPTTTADEVIESIPEDKNYDYIWLAEDVEKGVELIESGGYPLITAEFFASSSEQVIANLNREAEYDPIITAQEAANIAGNILIEAYGISQEDFGTLILNIATDFGYWSVYQQDIYSETEMGVPWRIFINIDATTGALNAVQVTPMELSYVEEMYASPTAESFVETENPSQPFATMEQSGLEDYRYNNMKIGLWDEDHEMFQTEIDKEIAALTKQLDGSPVLQGATLTELSIMSVPGSVDQEDLGFEGKLSDGRTIKLIRDPFYGPFLSFEQDRYPFRAYILDLHQI